MQDPVLRKIVGTTEEAGEVLITQFMLGNQSILVLVMGSKDLKLALPHTVVLL